MGGDHDKKILMRYSESDVIIEHDHYDSEAIQCLANDTINVNRDVIDEMRSSFVRDIECTTKLKVHLCSTLFSSGTEQSDEWLVFYIQHRVVCFAHYHQTLTKTERETDYLKITRTVKSLAEVFYRLLDDDSIQWTCYVSRRQKNERERSSSGVFLSDKCR